MVCDTTLRELPDGSWILFMLAGGDTEPSPLNYTGVTRSFDKGKTWTPLERFDVGFPREGKTIGQGPTELMILGQRSTLFFSTHSKHWANDWRSWFLTSDDSFKTWSKPQEVPGRLKERTFIRKHIVTRDGRIMLPFQHYIGPDDEQDKAAARPRIHQSAQRRAHQQRRRPDVDRARQHPPHAERPLLRLGRERSLRASRRPHHDGHPRRRAGRAVVQSGVQGRREDVAGVRQHHARSRIPAARPRSTISAATRVAILHNPNSKHRSPMALWISFDGMKTWPYQRVLQAESCDGPKGRMNYPDGFVSQDKQWLHFAFDDNRHRAVHYSAKLPPLP